MPAQDIPWALRELRQRRAQYQLFRNYYDGDHRLLFASEKFRNAFGDLFQSFADNLCAPVVDALVDRLQIKGFTVKSGDEALSTQLDTIWTANAMDISAGEVHQDAAKEGDSYVIVWPGEDGMPRIWPQATPNCCVRYDEEDRSRIVRAAKVWSVEEGEKYRIRLTLYYPDVIERYVTDLRSDRTLPDRPERFRPLVEGEEPEVPNPWGVTPVFHFANNAPIGRYGRSELKDVVPLQDALNKSIADMLVAMEFNAFQQRWATGVEVPLDDMGRPVEAPWKPGADRVWTVGDPAARFGQFDPADLEGFIKAQEGFRFEIARVSATPPSYLMLMGGEFPSGESQKVSEARLVKKAEDRMLSWGHIWEQVGSLCLRMVNAADGADLSAQWEDPETRFEETEVRIQEAKQRVGVSARQSLRELGYSEEQIETMFDEKREEGGALGEALLAQFDQGAPE